MILVVSILIRTSSCQGPAHPFSTAKKKLQGSYARIRFLDDAVKLSTGTSLQYHTMQANKLWKESEMKTKYTEKSERHCRNDETFDDNVYFDSYENLPSFCEEFLLLRRRAI
jgi:hypothetical protein